MNPNQDPQEAPPAPSDEHLEEVQLAELEQATQNTSRKLLTLLAIGAVLLLIIHTTPFGEKIRNWDSLA